MPLKYDPDKIVHTPGRTIRGLGDWHVPLYDEKGTFIINIHGKDKVEVIMNAEFVVSCFSAEAIQGPN